MGATQAVLGLNCKLYYNSGSHGSPTWVLIDNVRDVTLNLTKSEADVTTRGNGGWKALKGALKEAAIDFEMIWDTADTVFALILAAWLSGDPVEFLILDGLVATAGSQGLRATCEVFEFSRSEPLENASVAKSSIKPTISANPPVWYTAS